MRAARRWQESTMAQQKRGLGRGLGALIPTAPAGVPDGAAVAPGQAGAGGVALVAVGGAYFDEIPVGAITPNPRQPRQVFDEDALAELAARSGRSGCCSR